MAMETHNRVVYEGEAAHPVEHTEEVRREEVRDPSRGEMVARGGTALAMFAGLATIVLAILGLVDILPLYMAGISAIVVGAALLFEGGSRAAWMAGARERLGEFAEGGVSTQAIGGIAGIVLGILALMGINPVALLSIAVLTVGASLFAGGWSAGSSGAKQFIGLASVVLGILSLVGYVPLTLTLVAFLCLGAGSLLSGTAYRLVSGARPA